MFRTNQAPSEMPNQYIAFPHPSFLASRTGEERLNVPLVRQGMVEILLRNRSYAYALNERSAAFSPLTIEIGGCANAERLSTDAILSIASMV